MLRKSHVISSETRTKIAKALRGRKLSPEHCVKLSEAHKGIKLSPEHCAKISAANHDRAHLLSPEAHAKLVAANRMRIGEKRSLATRIKMSAMRRGENNPNWKGGRCRSGPSGRGYFYILHPDHPFATRSGYVAEHRLVVEAHLGRTLLPTEVVHHINGDIEDNHIENLMLFSSQGKHRNNHGNKRRGGLRGNTSTIV